MAFGGSTGFSGFGANNNNNNQTGTGFGGFGASNSTGFGQTQNTGFGATSSNAGGGLFGTGGGGFGTSSASPFGAANKPAFGAATTSAGGGLFGTNTATAGGSGFGSGFGANNNAGTGFGGAATSTGGGLFGGANKPFGGGGGTGLFGGTTLTNNATTGTGFGAGATTGGGLFGSAQGTALGANTNDCQGTGSTPFQPYIEKEGAGPTSNYYQSISFMEPYKKYSFEELRLADYNAGRKYGNASGQAGAFGTSTGFGGFGTTNQTTGTGFGTTGTGLFGQTSTAATGFGNNTQTAGAFGSAGGGLFGQKPATTGLFGTTASSAQPSTSIFGTAGNTGFGTQQNTGFGAGNTGNSIFANANQQKPGGFGFGTPAATTGTGFGTGTVGGFGTANAGTGTSSIFGQNQTQNQPQTGSVFGNAQQNQAANPFGQATQNQNQPSATFGGFGATNQQKPSIFGTNNATNTGTGLFQNAQNNQQQPANSIFGNTGNTNTGGLFANKPAAGAGGLFPNTNTNTGGTNIFSNLNQNQGQQNQGNSIFGNNNQQQQKPGSIFGNGTGLFTNTTQQPQNNGGLFNTQNNNQAQGSIFGNNSTGVLGGQQQNSLQPPQAMTASLNDATPYGSSSIFSGLPPPPQNSPGPIATPISVGQKQKKPAALPQYKINPAHANRLVTPQKRGYGFTYSTYGTPSSASSVASTPGGLTSSLLGASIGRSLGKSFSTSNLRRTFDTDGESILSPGAFSANSTRYSGSGSLRKLNIDRSLRTDLFGNGAIAALPAPEKNDASRSPSILKKKVSFDATTVGGNGSDANGKTNGHDNQQSSNPSAQEQGFLRSSHGYNGRANGSRSNNGQAVAEMEQVKGNELAIVPEDESPESNRTAKTATRDQSDPEPGEYWIIPSIEELKRMPRDQLKHVSDVRIGRERCGYVHFDKPVDLTTVDLNNIFGNIAVITVRSITVYPKDVKKPPVGMGLNVPSTICLENSWPRQRDKKTPSYEKSGPRFEKHIKRLASVKETEFVRYDAETGEWQFRVAHFTTYGLDYDDDEENDPSQIGPLDSSLLSEAPSTPTPKSRTPKTRTSPLAPRTNDADASVVTEASTQASSEPEDTFGYKKRRLFPGSFDDEMPFFEDGPEMVEIQQDDESFLGERSAVSQSEDEEDHDEPSEIHGDTTDDQLLVVRDEADDNDTSMDMAGSFPAGDATEFPKSILKNSMQQPFLGTPGNILIDLGNDWTEQLQRTISPKKQDREALRQSQARLFRGHDNDAAEETPKTSASKAGGGEISTSIDLMNSLFGKEEARRSGRAAKKTTARKGFQWPFPKTESMDDAQMTDSDRAFHNSFKPAWGPGNILLYGTEPGNKSGISHSTRSLSRTARSASADTGRDIRFSRFAQSGDITLANFEVQADRMNIELRDGVPFATRLATAFEGPERPGRPKPTEAHHQEKFIWDLVGILFDDYDDEVSDGIPHEIQLELEDRIRKDRLAVFWAELCQESAMNAVAAAQSAEERAIAYLSSNKVPEACNALVEGKNFRLATLVAQVGGDRTVHENMKAQIEEWTKLNILSEMSIPIRSLYEILAGNTYESVGKKGPVEDRAETFLIGERFNLDWKQSFGMKLWYSILDDSPLEEAVDAFQKELAQGKIGKPLPWFLEKGGLALPFQDPYASEREDVLWGILKLYANSKSKRSDLSIAKVVMPENVTGNPLQTRLSFELLHELAHFLPSQATAESSDRLTLAFADEVSSFSWLWSLTALMRLSNPHQRERALQATLARSAPLIDTSDQQMLDNLFNYYLIPESWLWEAKALHARAIANSSSPDADHTAEIRFLLRARSWPEAHRSLCSTVAPLAVIEREYSILRELLDAFDKSDLPGSWDRGGQLYVDYLRLVANETESTERDALLRRLVRALSDFGRRSGPHAGAAGAKNKKGKKGRHSQHHQQQQQQVDMEASGATFLHRVAVQEMCAVVGEAVLRDTNNSKDRAWILQLPLTSESKRARATELSWEFYKKVMGSKE